MPDFIALIYGLGIGPVVMVLRMAFIDEGIDPVARESQKRAHQTDALQALLRHRDVGHRLHARNAAQPRSAKEVQHERLGIVIRVMCHRHSIIAMFQTERGEPVITQFARRHLDALRVLRRVPLRIKIHGMEHDAMGCCPAAYKFRVSITFLAAQMEIAMRYRNVALPAAMREQLRHADGVGPTAYSKKGCFPFRNQPHQNLVKFFLHV